MKKVVILILLTLASCSENPKKNISSTTSIFNNKNIAFTMEEITDTATDEIMSEVNAIRRERGYSTLEKDALMNFSAKQYSARKYEPLDSLEEYKFKNLSNSILYEKKTISSEDKMRMIQYLLNIANDIESSIEEYEKVNNSKISRWGAGFYTVDGNEWYFTFIAN